MASSAQESATLRNNPDEPGEHAPTIQTTKDYFLRDHKEFPVLSIDEEQEMTQKIEERRMHLTKIMHGTPPTLDAVLHVLRSAREKSALIRTTMRYSMKKPGFTQAALRKKLPTVISSVESRMNAQRQVTEKFIQKNRTFIHEALLKVPVSTPTYKRIIDGLEEECPTEARVAYEEYDESLWLLVQHNKKLIAAVAGSIANGNQDLEGDFISEGSLTARNMADRFEPKRGFKFSTPLTYSLQHKFLRLRDLHYERQKNLVYLDWPHADHEEGIDIADTSNERVEEKVYGAEDEARLQQLLQELDQKDGRVGVIIRERFGLNEDRQARTLKDVGAQLKVTKERIRQIEARGIRHLQKLSKEA